MTYFDEPLSLLSDEFLEPFRDLKYGELNLRPAVDYLKLVRSELERGEQIPDGTMPANFWKSTSSGINNQLNDLIQRMNEFLAQGPTSSNQQPKDLAAVASGILDVAFREVRPYIRPEAEDLSASVDAYTKAAEALESRIEALAKVEDVVRGEAAGKAASNLAKHYSDEATKNLASAKHFQIVGWVGVGVLAALAAGSFFWLAPQIPSSKQDSSVQVFEFVRDVLGRLTLGSAERKGDIRFG